MIYIKGTFGKQKVSLLRLKSKTKTRNIVVFFHGACSTSLKNKYIQMASRIVGKGLADCILFESSRTISYQNASKAHMKFEDYVKTFEGKTYKQELKDAEIVMSWIKNKYKRKDINLHCVGMSLGGIIVGKLAVSIRSIKSITLLGSGTKIQNAHGSLTKTVPHEDTIVAAFKRFKGILNVMHGSSDDTILLKDAQTLYENSELTRLKKMTALKGVDHRFMYIHKKKSEEMLSSLIERELIQTILTANDLFSTNNS